MVVKRNGHYYCYFSPFKTKKVGLKLDVECKAEAKQVETMLLRACRRNDYSGLDSVSREALCRLFVNQNWELPHELSGIKEGPREELTLWKACEMFLKSPEIKARDYKAIARYKQAIINLARLLGKGVPLKEIWVPALKRYRVERINEGAAPNTVNIELSALSRVSVVMIEAQLLESNPCRLLKRLSTKSNEREVYLSRETVGLIAEKCPVWYQRIIWTAYFSGMRRGEMLGLTRRQVNLSTRLIHLEPTETKEGRRKRVPIHRELVPILEEAMRTPLLGSDKVFVVQDAQGIRKPGTDSFDNPWPRACEALEKAKLLEQAFSPSARSTPHMAQQCPALRHGLSDCGNHHGAHA